MATLSSTYLTLADLASRLDGQGNVADVINVATQTNEILDDMLWTEGNLPTGHKTIQVVGLPSVYYRLVNAGVPRGRASTVAITEGTAMIEAYSLVDKDLAAFSGDPAKFRLIEDMSFVQSMNITMAQALFYGNALTAPEQFNGLAPRYSTVNQATTPSAANVIDAGGTGSTNSSIWLVCWGATSIHGIYPKGSQSGLTMEDVSTPAPVLDANGNPYQAYQTKLGWKCGLALRDWRYVVRIANIDVTTFSTGAAPDIVNLLIQAVQTTPTIPSSAGVVQSATGQAPGGTLSFGRPAIYMNRRLRTMLDIQQRNSRNSYLTQETIQGRPVLTFRGIPIRTSDALLMTESRVV